MSNLKIKSLKTTYSSSESTIIAIHCETQEQESNNYYIEYYADSKSVCLNYYKKNGVLIKHNEHNEHPNDLKIISELRYRVIAIYALLEC